MKNELNKHSNIVLPDLGSCYKKLKQTFTNLSDEELKGLLRPDSVKYYKKGELIYAEGTRIKGCYFIYSGIIKIYQKQFRTLSRLFFENPLQINFENRSRTYEEKIYEASD